MPQHAYFPVHCKVAGLRQRGVGVLCEKLSCHLRLLGTRLPAAGSLAVARTPMFYVTLFSPSSPIQTRNPGYLNLSPVFLAGGTSRCLGPHSPAGSCKHPLSPLQVCPICLSTLFTHFIHTSGYFWKPAQLSLLALTEGGLRWPCLSLLLSG